MRLRHPIAWLLLVSLAAFPVVLGTWFGGLLLFTWLISDPGHPGPPLPVVWGARANGEDLSFSFGSECQPPATVSVLFASYANLSGLTFSFSIDEPLSEFEIGALPSSATVLQKLPESFDWHKSSMMSVLLQFGDQSWSWRSAMSESDMAEVMRSEMHPLDEFYFREIGWSTPSEVAARDGVDLLTFCHPATR